MTDKELLLLEIQDIEDSAILLRNEAHRMSLMAHKLTTRIRGIDI